MRNVLVVAPHPDDETLGCGGTLLRHRADGCNIHWLIVTDMSEENGYPLTKIIERSQQIAQVASCYDFHSVTNLALPPARLDTVPMQTIIQRVSELIQKIEPEVVYLPYSGDIHTDHKIVFDAAASCLKSFRSPSIRRVMVYETISETEFGIAPDIPVFKPNVFVDIEKYFEQKIKIMKLYTTEIGDFPFPRSSEAITALAQVRGATSNSSYAEAFMLIKEVVR